MSQEPAAAQPESIEGLIEALLRRDLAGERRLQLKALVRADWRAALASELVRLGGADPQSRSSLLSTALAFGIGIEDFPAEVRRDLGDLLVVTKEPRRDASTFVRQRMAKRSLGNRENNLAQALVAEIVRAPHCFDPDQLADLVTRIKSQPLLFRRALSHPMLRSFPEGLQLCLDGVRSSNESLASIALAVLIKWWPDQLESAWDLIVSRARSSRYLLRLATVPALARLADTERQSEVVDLLRHLLSDPESVVRKEALGVLVQVVGTKAAPELTVALRDPNANVRIEACQQIADLRDAKFVEVLRERIIDAEATVRRAAFVAIAELDRDAAAQSADAFVRRG